MLRLYHIVTNYDIIARKEANMLNCNLTELPMGGVVWTLIVFGFIMTICLFAFIALRDTKKK